MLRKKRFNLLLLTVLCVSALLFGITARQIIRQQNEYRAARDEYSDLRELAGADVSPLPDTPPNESNGIDFDALFSINPRTVGWIRLPDSNISYPIVQGSDNWHYLHHTFSGRRNASGAVFLDFRDEPDFQGTARIFAHNMRDGSMFGTLRNWNGDIITIYTPDGEVTEFAVTFRGAVSLAEVRVIEEFALITCVNGRPDLRFVVRAEKIH